MKLTENFELLEFEKSTNASALGIYNKANENVIANLKNLCVFVLEPIRSELNKIDNKESIHISSGYRCFELNRAKSGAINSNHLYGFASDIYARNTSSYALFTLIKEMVLSEKIKLTELFYEKSGRSEWVHIAYNPEKLINKIKEIKK
jgi:hypothetical protein